MTLATTQARLISARLLSGLADGKWGPQTERAVEDLMDKLAVPKLAGPLPPKTPMIANADASHAQYTIEMFIAQFIKDYEGGLSVDKDDTGNFYKGKLVGSKYGVTGAALADYRNVTAISASDIANLGLPEAIQVGLELYYDRPDFDLLPWDPITASCMDAGWMSGPGQAVKLLQRMVVAADDGVIGPRLVAAYQDYKLAHGLEQTASDWCRVRFAFFDKIIKVRPTNTKYRDGWRRRASAYLPGTAFWNQWHIAKSNS